jgi:hypothetical protein
VTCEGGDAGTVLSGPLVLASGDGRLIAGYSNHCNVIRIPDDLRDTILS